MNKTKMAIIAGDGFYWLYRWITYQIFMAFIVLAHWRRGVRCAVFYKTKSTEQDRTIISIHCDVHPLPRSPPKTWST